MAYGFGSELEQHDGQSRTLGAALRTAGRVALWVLVCLLLVRGAAGILSSPSERPVARENRSGSEQSSDAFAVRFARTYLEAPSPEALAPYLAAGAHIGTGRPPSTRGAEVAQAEVVRSAEVGADRAVLTVACELRDSRTLYLAVPVARFRAGEVAALGAPSIVAVPAVAGVDPERPQPLAGPDAAQIEALVAKFMPAYLSAAEASDLSYYLAPDASVIPLGGQVKLADISGASQLGGGEGAQRSVIVAARVRDPDSGATYPLAYRLALIRRGGRWYVSAVEGAIA